jgi:hypothetical protein
VAYDETVKQFVRSTDLSEPDAMLASQFFDAAGRCPQLEGERRLMVAVLVDAVHCFQQNRAAVMSAKRVLFRQTRRWITSGDESWFFSFENVCETLGIEPSSLRRALLAWERADVLRQRTDVPEAAKSDTAARGGSDLVHQGRASRMAASTSTDVPLSAS